MIKRSIVRHSSRCVAQRVTRTLNPLDFNPLAWWDAADASTITLNGSDVAGWADKSGNVYDLVQATAADQPAYANNTISFDGVSEYLWRAESFMYSATKTLTIFMVMESSAAADARILAEGNSLISAPFFSPFQIALAGNEDKSKIFYRDADNTFTGDTTSGNDFFESGITKVYSIEDDLSNITTMVNGGSEVVTAYTRPGSTFTLNRFAIGIALRSTVSNHANIDVNEILIFHTALSPSQKEQITTYLMDKWSI